jgi:hypothetical protein
VPVMVLYPGLLLRSDTLSFSEEGPHASPSGRVSSISCHRSHTAWRGTPRALAISAQDRPAFRAHFTLTSSMWSHVWPTCWIAVRVATTSAFQLWGLDLDNPVDRGPFIALWTVNPPLYLAMDPAPGTPARVYRSHGIGDEITRLHSGPKNLQEIRPQINRIPRHDNTHPLSVAITARTQGSLNGASATQSIRISIAAFLEPANSRRTRPRKCPLKGGRRTNATFNRHLTLSVNFRTDPPQTPTPPERGVMRRTPSARPINPPTLTKTSA